MPERIDRVGENRTALAKNKRIILRTQNICGICGMPVDKSLKSPDPMSPTVDHIIPIAKGGHPSDLENLQLAHRWCNRQKSDRLFLPGHEMNRRQIDKTASAKEPVSGKAPALKKPRVIKNHPDPTRESETNRAGSGREEIDNNDLPLHADWGSYTW